jgi:hypothetical protein
MFPIFTINSGGSPSRRGKMMVSCINETIPRLADLGLALDTGQVEVHTTKSFVEELGHEVDTNSRLRDLFNYYGSDKGSTHDYFQIYEAMLGSMGAVSALLEIGLGSQNSNILSNMGPLGHPGASVRAFRDFLPNALIFGADVDSKMLFQEERIRTFEVDQTDRKSLKLLAERLPINVEFDIVIDDGLHAPHANIATLEFGLRLIRAEGWVVIEDIALAARPVWNLVGEMLPKTRYRSYLIESKASLVFAVQRIA